jgi:4-hydroxy-3-methylbut-2-enyl diphosphate reductase
MTSGASCPDAIVEGVIARIVGLFPDARTLEEVGREWMTEE